MEREAKNAFSVGHKIRFILELETACFELIN